MIDEEMMDALQETVDIGFIAKHADGSFSMNAAGKAYVEQVLIPDVTDRIEIFALGRLQGLREAVDKQT